MTILLYQTDSYLRSFQAQITQVDPENHAVQLNQTAFFPGGGGQPNDQGLIQTHKSVYPVVKVRKVNDQVLHFLGGDIALPQNGTEVNCELDWNLRYQIMRTHTAMHILCGVIFRDYGASVTGGDMEPLLGRMDFEFETMRKEFVTEIEQAVNMEVQAARPVRTEILPREEAFKIPDLIRTKINLLPEGIQEIRVVEIIGLDLQADGGTHVRNTSEVGPIHLVDYKSKGKINKRIYLKLEEII
jgi:misacylated tRNA(Ala) deacylase